MPTMDMVAGWNHFSWPGAAVGAKALVDANQPNVLLVNDDSICGHCGAGVPIEQCGTPPNCSAGMAGYVYGDPVTFDFTIRYGDDVWVWANNAFTLSYETPGDGGGDGDWFSAQFCLPDEAGICLPTWEWFAIGGGVVLLIVLMG